MRLSLRIWKFDLLVRLRRSEHPHPQVVAVRPDISNEVGDLLHALDI